jgi:enolase-phosphatase E1
MRLRAVVTDIEGTTSSIRFVHDVLFPYARQALRGYLKAHQATADVQAVCQAVAEETGVASGDLDAVADALERFMDEDRKWTPLKTLQGLIWAQGYGKGY